MSIIILFLSAIFFVFVPSINESFSYNHFNPLSLLNSENVASLDLSTKFLPIFDRNVEFIKYNSTKELEKPRFTEFVPNFDNCKCIFFYPGESAGWDFYVGSPSRFLFNIFGYDYFNSQESGNNTIVGYRGISLSNILTTFKYVESYFQISVYPILNKDINSTIAKSFSKLGFDNFTIQKSVPKLDGMWNVLFKIEHINNLSFFPKRGETVVYYLAVPEFDRIYQIITSAAADRDHPSVISQKSSPLYKELMQTKDDKISYDIPKNYQHTIDKIILEMVAESFQPLTTNYLQKYNKHIYEIIEKEKINKEQLEISEEQKQLQKELKIKDILNN